MEDLKQQIQALTNRIAQLESIPYSHSEQMKSRIITGRGVTPAITTVAAVTGINFATSSFTTTNISSITPTTSLIFEFDGKAYLVPATLR